MPSTFRKAEKENKPVECGGLLSGVTVFAIRILTENPWEGGAGYTYEQVGNMTQDQVAHRLADIDFLKDKGHRTKKIKSEAIAGEVPVNKRGQIKAVDKDGKPILLKTTGKSKVQMIRERNKQLQQQSKKKRRKK